jgi:predicted HD phosphohydrolase
VTPAPFRSVDELVDTLQRLDGQPTDDVVAALPHLLQTAQRLARDHPGDPELVVAGLVHDLATCLEPGCADHASAGAELVGPLFGARVAELVGGHTEAKRYLVTVEPGYAEGLTDNSTFTLIGQGGPMSPGERTAFERRVEFEGLVALRRADDLAKVPGAVVRSPSDWRPRLDQVAAKAR